MKKYRYFLTFIYFSILGCSDHSPEPTLSVAGADADSVMQKHVEITQIGIHAEFINAITKNKHDQAFSMLYPKLSEAWTKERFALDWNNIKKQLPSGWNPEATGSFSGNSPQGLYEQATFRLESNWDSIASLDLISMKIEGKNNIVKIHIRIPRVDDAPIAVVSLTNDFIEAMLAENYETV